MKSLRTPIFILFLGMIEATSSTPLFSQQQVLVENAIRNDTSPALRSLLAPARPTREESEPLRVDRRRLALNFAPVRIDTSLQAVPGPNLPLTIIASFDAVMQGESGWIPPDPSGAVGAAHYVLAVNNSLSIFEKATRSLVYGPVPIRTLWQRFGGACEERDDGDPVVAYDRHARRWIITQFQIGREEDDSGYYSQCVVVSESADALGRYYRYEFKYPEFNDYGKLGVWPDAYYAVFNMFKQGEQLGSRVCAYERPQMLLGGAARQVCFQLNSAYMSLLPSDLDGPETPPAGTPNYFFGLGLDSRTLNYWKFRLDWTQPERSTFGSGPQSAPDGYVRVQRWDNACADYPRMSCIPQRGTLQLLSSVGERLMYRLAYRWQGDHATLVASHSVETPRSESAIRWYEIRIVNDTPMVRQQGTYAPDAYARWVPSIAMDRLGNIALGYSISGDSLRPGIRLNGRTADFPLGTLGNDTTAATRVVEGGGSQTPRGRVSNYRWGDYAQLSVDPDDDCTFWFSTEYHPRDGRLNWSIRTVVFRFENCASTTIRANSSASSASVDLPADPSRFQMEQWGGPQARLTRTRTGLWIEFPCAHAVIDDTLSLANSFEAKGVYVFERGGAVRDDTTERAYEALFSGRVDRNTLTLSIRLIGSHQTIEPIILHRGARTTITKCL